MASTRSEAQCAATEHRTAEGEGGAKMRNDHCELRMVVAGEQALPPPGAVKKPKVFSQPLVAGEQASPPYTPPGTIEARKGFGSTIRNSRLAALPLATLLPLSSAWSLRVFAPPCADACAVFRGCALRFAPCARHSSPSGLRCSQSSLAALPASLGSSYRPALRWPGIPGLRSASRCPHPFTPSGLRRLRPVSRTARGLRAPLR